MCWVLNELKFFGGCFCECFHFLDIVTMEHYSSMLGKRLKSCYMSLDFRDNLTLFSPSWVVEDTK
jgi:hypothetical protein